VREVLAHAETWEKADIWCTFSQKVYSAAAAEYSGMLGNQASVLKYYEGYARGLYLEMLSRHWESLQKLSVLERAGFKVSFQFPHEKIMALDSSSALYTHQLRLARHAWSTLFEIIRWRSLTHTWYTDLAPGRFAALLSESTAVVLATLKWCERAWKGMQECESKRHVYKECADLWKCVPQCERVIVREILCMLPEHSFGFVSPHVKAAVTSMFSLGSTISNEKGFGYLQRRLDHTQSKRLATTTCWKELAEAKVFDEMGRKNTKPADCKQEPLPEVPAKGYMALGGSASFDKPKMEDIMLPAKTWLPISSLKKNHIAAAFTLMMDVPVNAKMDALPNSWLALLPIRSDIVRRTGSDNCFVVLETSRFAFLGAPCSLVAPGGVMARHKVIFAAGEKCKWFPLVNPDEWECFVTDVAPPVASLARGQPPIIAVEARGPKTLTERASLLGFKQFSGVYIEKLLQHFEVRKKCEVTPKTMLEKVGALIAFFLPKISQEQLNAAFAARAETTTRASGVLSSSSVLADTVLDPSDKKLMKDVEEQQEKRAVAATQTRAALTGGSKFLEALGVKKAPFLSKKPVKKVVAVDEKPKKKVVDWEKVADQKAANDLMPVMKGASIQLVTPKTCWTAYYPGCSPGSRTRTWGPRWSRGDCLKHCVKWAWEMHCKAGHSPCPFEL
jgi:hypothetical protein